MRTLIAQLERSADRLTGIVERKKETFSQRSPEWQLSANGEKYKNAYLDMEIVRDDILDSKNMLTYYADNPVR